MNARPKNSEARRISRLQRLEAYGPLTHECLLNLLSYDQMTGMFTRKRGPKINKPRGHLGKGGYWMIGVRDKIYMAGRLAWFYVHGVWPTHEIDHKNQIKTDNWIDNLRDVTGRINKQNQHLPRKHNKLGIVGVRKNGRKYTAQFGKIKIGYFHTAEEAHQAYLEVKKLVHPRAFLL